MKNSSKKRLFSLLLSLVLIAATALMTTGCESKSAPTTTSAEVQTIGEGEKTFSLIVIDKDGSEAAFEVKTNAETVGEALIENGIIEGEEGPFGLFIKSVNGIEADYDKDQTYWAFYVNGEYASTGVDLTNIEEGMAYSLKVEK